MQCNKRLCYLGGSHLDTRPVQHGWHGAQRILLIITIQRFSPGCCHGDLLTGSPSHLPQIINPKKLSKAWGTFPLVAGSNAGLVASICSLITAYFGIPRLLSMLYPPPPSIHPGDHEGVGGPCLLAVVGGILSGLISSPSPKRLTGVTGHGSVLLAIQRSLRS